MTVNELIETLSQIQENGYGKLPVAIKDYGILCETMKLKYLTIQLVYMWR